MKKNKIKGFTLVELLAVIVILAIILVIAVPKVMSVIEDSKKATLESTAKMIASQAEKVKVQNTVLGNTDRITCDSVAKINDVDYEDCDVDFDENTAKVTIKGSGKFAGLYVCNGTKTNATAQEDRCISVTKFADDDWSTIVAAVKQAETNGTEYPYNVGDEKTINLGDLGIHTIRVANTTKCEGLEVEMKTACGFVLEFADIIIEYVMNDDYTNDGGWPASKMRMYVNSDIYNALPAELRSEIINTYVVSSCGSNTTIENLENENAGVLENGNYWSNDKLYLLSIEEVSGMEIIEEGVTRQLDYYATYKGTDYIGVSSKNYEGAIKAGAGNGWWWLRSANPYSKNFFSINHEGALNDSYSDENSGVSPAFRLAN